MGCCSSRVADAQRDVRPNNRAVVPAERYAPAVVVVELGARNAGDAQTPATRSVRDLPRVIPEGVVDIEAQRPQQTGSLADRRAEYSVPRVLASTEHVGDRSSRVAGAQPDARPNIRAAAPAEVQAPVVVAVGLGAQGAGASTSRTSTRKRGKRSREAPSDRPRGIPEGLADIEIDQITENRAETFVRCVSALIEKKGKWRKVPKRFKLPKAHLFLHRGDEVLLVKQRKSGKLGLPKGGLQADIHDRESQACASATSAQLPYVRGVRIDRYRDLHSMSEQLRNDPDDRLRFLKEWVHCCVRVMVAVELWEETGLTFADLKGPMTLVWRGWGVGFTARVRKGAVSQPQDLNEIDSAQWRTRSAIPGMPRENFNNMFHRVYRALSGLCPVTLHDHGQGSGSVAVDDGLMEVDG